MEYAMNSENKIIDIDYYSDVLCVWAWIAQPRLEELEKQWGSRISIRHHFVDIFGDCEKKIPSRWGKENGYEKFAEHVKVAAEPFEQAIINKEIWTASRPRSSAQAHLVLRAADLVAGPKSMCDLALRIRRAFFVEAKDVSDLDILLELAADEAIDTAELRQCLKDGSAIAALSSDLRSAADRGVRGSPTWVLNEGRQVIYGNVGYRVLNANVEELLNRPVEEASWC
jgi:predicted DsbA family dithiol-disulfide isomerase